MVSSTIGGIYEDKSFKISPQIRPLHPRSPERQRDLKIFRVSRLALLALLAACDHQATRPQTGAAPAPSASSYLTQQYPLPEHPQPVCNLSPPFTTATVPPSVAEFSWAEPALVAHLAPRMKALQAKHVGAEKIPFTKLAGGVMKEGQSAEIEVPLWGQACATVIAVGAPTVEQIEISINTTLATQIPSLGIPSHRSSGTGSTLVMGPDKACVKLPGMPFNLRVTLVKGSGELAAQLFWNPSAEPSAPAPAP